MSLRWLSAAVAATVAAVFLLLLALDIGSWQTTLARGDVRFKTAPTRADLWRPKEILPFHLSRRLLDLDDDIAYRETLRSFWLARPHANRWAETNVDALRSKATVALANFLRTSANPYRRSQAANLLGVMGLGLAASDDPGQRLRFLLYASKSFRGALTMDQNNEDAKFNLELTLRLLRQQPTSTGGGAAHVDGLHLAARADVAGVVEIAVEMGRADKHRRASCLVGDPLDRFLRGAHEPRPQEEILGRVAGDRELGEDDDIRGIGLRLGEPVEDQVAVPVEVADDRVDLGQSEAHSLSLAVYDSESKTQ